MGRSTDLVDRRGCDMGPWVKALQEATAFSRNRTLNALKIVEGRLYWYNWFSFILYCRWHASEPSFSKYRDLLDVSVLRCFTMLCSAWPFVDSSYSKLSRQEHFPSSQLLNTVQLLLTPEISVWKYFAAPHCHSTLSIFWYWSWVYDARSDLRYIASCSKLSGFWNFATLGFSVEYELISNHSGICHE